MRCEVVDLDDLHTEMAEIDENLIRANLSPAQEAAAVSRRKVIYETLNPETKAGAARWNQNENISFSSATAVATGKNKRTVEMAVARGKALGDDLGAIAGTSPDKGAEMDALAKLPADERKFCVHHSYGRDLSAHNGTV